jgi:MarR family transcriptional regulator, temperature-dependent positive regulator of motility
MNSDFPSKFTEAKQSPGFLLWQVNNLWQKRQREALVKINLTHVQFVLLAGIAWLQYQGKAVSQVMLADHSKVDIMMTSQVARSLKAKGLITRKPHPHDTRALLLQLTKEGEALVKKALPIIEGVDRFFFNGLKENKAVFCKQLLQLLSADNH